MSPNTSDCILFKDVWTVLELRSLSRLQANEHYQASYLHDETVAQILPPVTRRGVALEGETDVRRKARAEYLVLLPSSAE